MRLLITGATGYLGWRATVLLRERGHEVTPLARPGARERTASQDLDAVALDAGSPDARALVAGHDAVLHFAGVPSPAFARDDPAAAVLGNAGTTLNLLEGCREHDVLLVYPSSIRAGVVPSPDPYAASKRLGEQACLAHEARSAIVRLTSVFGPGQVHWEGATGAIAAFAARALAGEPIVIPGDPARTRDFVYVDDLVAGLDGVVRGGAPADIVIAASGTPTSLLDAARAVVAAVGNGVVETPGGEPPPGDERSYEAGDEPRLALDCRPIGDAIHAYVDWLRAQPGAPGRRR
ncbi:MAG: NAD(P)-dependent oxidoreductase [Solirubrobacteraceae bacterium]|nr:NAD(P)-dependent oxidoreductase [Solirubrobacteraceae bacterium]